MDMDERAASLELDAEYPGDRKNLKGRIRILSDGTSHGTRVYDAESGNEIKGVYKAEWKCEVGGKAEAVLYFHDALIDAVAEKDG